MFEFSSEPGGEETVTVEVSLREAHAVVVALGRRADSLRGHADLMEELSGESYFGRRAVEFRERADVDRLEADELIEVAERLSPCLGRAAQDFVAARHA